MQGHDRKKLSQRPVVEEGLEDGKIAEHLVAEGNLEVLHFLRHVTHIAEKLDHLGRDAPVDSFDLRFGRKVEQPKSEHRIGLLPDLLRVMQAFQPVFAAERSVNLQDILNDGGITPGRFHFRPAGNFFDRPERLDDEDGMVSGNGAAALANQDRMGHFFLVADFLHRTDHVTGVLVQGVIDRAVEGRARPVVIDAEAPTHIEVAELVAELVQLGVETGGLAHRALDRTDIGNLRSDVKMHQLEAMGHAFAPEQFTGLDKFRGGKTELGVLTAARRPFPGAFGREPDADADPWLDPHLFGDGEDLC